MSSVFKSIGGARAIFVDIGEIAHQEKIRLSGSKPETEPAEIQSMRRHAAEESRAIVMEAQRQAERIREEAYRAAHESGYEEGKAAGLEAGRAEMQRERDAYRTDLGALVEQIESERRRIWEEAEPQIMAFVLEIAHKVIKDEAKINRDIALSVIRNALRRVVDTENIRIRVNAADLETVRAAREEIVSLLDGARHVEIIDDRRIGPGGSVVETNAGTIDSTLDTQLHEIAIALEEMVEEAA